MKIISIFALALFIAVFGASAHAEMMGKKDISVMTEPSGTYGMTKVVVNASGLEPADAYSIYMVKGDDMKGVGIPPYKLSPDSQGNISTDVMVTTDSLKNNEAIKIYRHEDGNVNNLDKTNLKEVFSKNVSTLNLQ
ncbi:MAG: hypothetical protein PHE18_02870 [Candidatus Omnitrophica bacterium]|nr:hypothetical protein [Candidatus Omnitrophota bacterium]